MITTPIIVLAALTGDAEGQTVRLGARSLQWNSVIANDGRRCSDYCGYHGAAYYWCHCDKAKEGGDKDWSYCKVDYGAEPTTEPTVAIVSAITLKGEISFSPFGGKAKVVMAEKLGVPKENIIFTHSTSTQEKGRRRRRSVADTEAGEAVNGTLVITNLSEEKATLIQKIVEDPAFTNDLNGGLKEAGEKEEVTKITIDKLQKVKVTADVRSVRKGVYSRIQWATDEAQTQKEVMITTSRAGGVYALDPQDPSNILGCFLPRADDELVQDTNEAGYMKFQDAARDFTKGGGQVCPLATDGVIAFEGQSRLGNVFVASSICRDSSISGSPACPNIDGTDTPMLYVWFNLEATLGRPDKIIPLMGTDPTWRWRASLHVDLGTVKRGEWEYMIAGVSNGFEYFKNSDKDTDGMAAVTIARRKADGADNQFQGLSSTDEFPPPEATKAAFEPVEKAIVHQYNFYSAVDVGFIVGATEGTAIVPITKGDKSQLFVYTAAVNGASMAGSEIEINDEGYVEGLKTPVQVPHGDNLGFEIKQQVSRSFIANDGKTRIIVSSNFQNYGFVMKYKVNAAADENGNMLTYLGAGAVRTDSPSISHSGANRVILFRVPKKITNGQPNPQYCTYAVIPFKKPALVGIFDVTSSGDEEKNLEAVKKVSAVQITGETIYALEVMPTGASRTHATAEEGQGGLHTFNQDESGYVSFNVLAPLHSAKDKTMRTIKFKLRLCQDEGERL